VKPLYGSRYVDRFGPAVFHVGCRNDTAWTINENGGLNNINIETVLRERTFCGLCGERLTRDNLSEGTIKASIKTRIVDKKFLLFRYKSKEKYWDIEKRIWNSDGEIVKKRSSKIPRQRVDSESNKILESIE